MNIKIEDFSGIKLTVGDQVAYVSVGRWDKATDVMDIIAEYTECLHVRKLATINMVRGVTDCTLRQARMMACAYFEPEFEKVLGRGWDTYS